MTDRDRDMAKAVYIMNTGCQRRGLDASRLVGYFRSNACHITQDCSKADVIVLTTCGFFGPKEDRSMAAIKELARHKGRLVVLGCLSGTSPHRLKEEYHGEFLSPKDYDQIDSLFPEFTVKFKDIPDSNFQYMAPAAPAAPKGVVARVGMWARSSLGAARRGLRALTRTSGNRTACLRIATGCLGNCSYCVIRNATGRLKSKPVEACLAEYVRLLDRGYRRFVFQGEDTGAYGLDIGSSLPELFSRLSEADKGLPVCWSIFTLNPQWLVRYRAELLDYIRAGKLVCLEIDVQAASERVLDLMNRKYDVAEVAAIIAESKKANPDVKIHLQVIVGFPSETEDDFEQTLRFIQETRVDSLQAFQYTDMEETAASNLADKVPEQVKERRCSDLRDLRQRQGLHPPSWE